MPAPFVIQRFGIQKTLPPSTEQWRWIKDLGNSRSSRRQHAMSKTERYLLTAPQPHRNLRRTTVFLRLKDLIIHDGERKYSENPAYRTYAYQSTMEYGEDEVQIVYDAVEGFHVPKVSIASRVGENDKDTMKDGDEIEENRFTQKDLDNLVHSSLRLVVSLKAPGKANADSFDLRNQGGSY